MNKTIKSTLKNVLEYGTLKDVQDAFTQYTLDLDDSYFDYELLKSALLRGDNKIAIYLLIMGCRIKSPYEKNPDETPLHLAVKNELLDIDELAERLIRKGASIYAKNTSGDTPLSAAFKAEHYEAIEALLSNSGFSSDPTNKDDMVHFHIACVRGELRAAQRYLECGLDPNAPLLLDSEEYAGLNPVQFAIWIDDIDLFAVLLKYCDLSIKNNEGLTPLHKIHYSAHNSFIKMETALLQQAFRNSNNKSALKNCEDEYGLSHFHLCCMLDESDLIQAFIDHGASVNSTVSTKAPRNAGFTPLHFAVLYNCKDVIKVLLENEADPDKKDIKGETPLYLASKTPSDLKKIDIIKILLNFKASPAVPDNKGCTPLHLLFAKNIFTFDEVTSKMPWGSVNYTDRDGVSLLHIASAVNNVDQVVRFLQAGVDVDSPATGWTALHFAAMHKRSDVVRELLCRNAQVDIRTVGSRRTPLHLACECNPEAERYMSDVASEQSEIIRLLLSHGADANARDLKGFTPLLHTCVIDLHHNQSYLDNLSTNALDALTEAIGIRCFETIKILALNTADVDARTESRESVLHLMSRYKFLKVSAKIVEYLVALDVDVNAVNEDGLTPLHVAAKNGNQGLVNSLLKHNADPNIKCKYSRIPLQLIVEKIMYKHHERREASYYDILSALLEYGSDVNVMDENGSTLLHGAVSNFDYDVVEKLLEYGADVNLTDFEGDCCVSKLLKMLVDWDYVGYLWPELFRIIYIHVQKLLALGLPLSKSLKGDCDRLYTHYKMERSMAETFSIVDRAFNECVNELGKMKEVKIDRYTSLYSVLLKSPQELATLVKNSSLSEIVNDSNVKRDFPRYSYLLKLQLKRGLKRSNVLQSAEEALLKVFKTYLPVACYESILKYLDDYDIALMKEVAPVKGNLKKLPDGTIQTESKSKL